MKWTFLAFLLMTSAARADTIGTEERLLRGAMTKKPDGLGREIPAGEFIGALIESGHVRRKPEALRADYIDFRRLRKPLSLFGHKVVVIEEEYLTTHIGCCVNPGLGLIVETRGDTGKLAAFAKDSGCVIGEPYDPEQALSLTGVKQKPGAEYLSVSCRERDAQE